MASGDPFSIKLHNPNNQANQGEGQSGNVGVIFLITERDDKKNTLELIIKNISGAGVTFDRNNPIYLTMEQLHLPEHVIRAIEVTCSGWEKQVDDDDGAGPVEGLILSPLSSATLANNDTLMFKLTNIVFSPADLDKVKPTLKDFVISYSVPEEGEASRAVQLKQWAVQPCPLYQVEAAFVSVPESQKWNVKMDEAEIWLDKDANTVFSNSLKNHQIRTRLAFSLINKDEDDHLKLTRDSVFKVSFLPGKGFRELADRGELARNVKVTELSTQDWKIVGPQDDASPEWTLTPLRELTLDSEGGSYTFLIDAVLANANPPDNTGLPSLTEMYVFYTKVPSRDGDGVYDDGYLAATISKIAPKPQVVSFDFDPKQDVYKPYVPNTLKWSVFGVDTVQLAYMDALGAPKSMTVRATGSQEIALPASGNTKIYKLMNGSTKLAECSAPVSLESMKDFLSSVELAQQAGPYKGSGAAAYTPCSSNFTVRLQTDETVRASVTITMDGHPEIEPAVAGTSGWNSWSLATIEGGYRIKMFMGMDTHCGGQYLNTGTSYMDLKCSDIHKTDFNASPSLETIPPDGAWLIQIYFYYGANGKLPITDIGAKWMWSSK